MALICFHAKYHCFFFTRSGREKDRCFHGYSRYVFLQYGSNVARIHVVPVDNDQFLDPTGHKEIPTVDDPQVPGLIKLPAESFHPHPEIRVVFHVAPVTVTNAVPLDVDLPYPAFFARFPAFQIHCDHGQALYGFAQADDLFALSLLTRNKAVPAQCLGIDPEGLVIPVRHRSQADILGKAVPRGKSIGTHSEQMGKLRNGDRIHKLGPVDKKVDVREVECCGGLACQDVLKDIICAVGSGGDVDFKIGQDLQPKGGFLQELQGWQEIRRPFQSHDGQINANEQAQVVKKRDPHGQVVPGGKVIHIQDLGNVGHQVSECDHNAFGITGRARCILQVHDIPGSGGMYGKVVRSNWQAVGIDSLQSQCGQQSLSGQPLFHVNFRVLRMFQGVIRDNESGFAGFNHRNEALYLSFVNGRRDNGKECAGHHGPVNGVQSAGVLQRENDHPVSLFGPFCQ
ncbi:MAG: hypothetical protein BWX93_01822 [Bacteroidetes bacterium ADurb.Bin139]|nr:MAG: hypothetical protein BWX93_01822 [Bacteroidetes bacterium ADurb.Bin139]